MNRQDANSAKDDGEPTFDIDVAANKLIHDLQSKSAEEFLRSLGVEPTPPPLQSRLSEAFREFATLALYVAMLLGFYGLLQLVIGLLN